MSVRATSEWSSRICECILMATLDGRHYSIVVRGKRTVLSVIKRRTRQSSFAIVNVLISTSNGKKTANLPSVNLLIPINSEFNHRRDGDGKCVLEEGTQPLQNDDSCRGDDEYWYERTPYRKVPISSCEGGKRLDRGVQHRCPGIKGHGFFFWLFIFAIPCLFAGLVGYWFYHKNGLARGYVSCSEGLARKFTFFRRTIRLPGPEGNPRYTSDSGVISTLASVPWFLIGLGGIAWEWVSSKFGSASSRFRSRRGYRHIPVDEDAQILRFEDEE